jgi:hypothetical protein
LRAAFAAENCFLVSFGGWPDLGSVAVRSIVTLTARKPFAAAFEFDRDYVGLAEVMRAARLIIHDCAVNHHAVDQFH